MDAHILLLALVCLAAVVTAGKGGKRGGRGGGKFRMLKECCPTFPLVLKEESIKTCVAARKASRTPSSEAAVTPGGSSEESGAEGTPSQGTTGKGKKGKNRGDKANRGCMMECAFKADGFTTMGSDGKEQLNLKALNDKLTTLATGEWETIIKDAQANCTSTPPPVRAGQNCTSGANIVAKCLFKYMFVKCPAPVSSDTCNQRLEMISQWKAGRRGGKGKNRESENVVQENTKTKDELEAMVQDEGAAQ